MDAHRGNIMKTIRKTAGVAILLLMLLLGALPLQAAGLNVRELTLRVGDSYTLKVKGAGKKKVSWKSSKKKVAAVSKKGVVKAKKTGSAKITAKVGKKKYTCKVTVREAVKRKKASDASGSASSTNKNNGGFTSSGITGEDLVVWTKILDTRVKGRGKYYYPEGMTYTNEHYYRWLGGIYRGGYGCAAFCFELSDECFGTNRSVLKTINDYVSANGSLKKLRPGDIVRTDYNTHSVLVVNHYSSGIVVAEANYNSAVHWGRKIPYSEILESGSNIITRYDTQVVYSEAALLKMYQNLPELYDPKN